MSNATHTPGPWKLHIERHAGGLTPHITGPGHVGQDTAPICTFNGNKWRDGSETVANANLIASAPDLLAACILFDRAFCGDGVSMSKAADACLLAIARAKGVQS